MKALMLDMLSAMMPYMKTIYQTGIAATIAAVVLYLIAKKVGYKAPLWAARFAMAFAIFFIACEIAGYFLDSPPSFRFFFDPKTFTSLIDLTYWQAGLLLLIPGWVVWSFSSNKLKAQ